MPSDRICCPKCGKFFDNQTKVQRHLDQPLSKCNQPNVQLVDPEYLLRHFKHRRVDPPPFPHRAFQAARDEPNSMDLDTSEDTASTDSDPESNDADDLTTEYFDGAAKVVDNNGRTFLKAFNEDEFAPIRESENLYYPFADRAEWDMAEFLLTSCLSMADIDRFLSLTLVSHFCV